MSVTRYPFIHVRTHREQIEAVSDRLWQSGAQGLEERDGSTMSHIDSDDLDAVLLIAGYTDIEAAEHALLTLSDHEASIEFLVGDDWRHEWKRYFSASQVSSRIFLRPSWIQAQTPEACHCLEIDPGAAFGSGIHETTQLCLMALDKYLDTGQHVLDVGTGSGILAIAASLLGSTKVHAFDIDSTAIDVALENSAKNRCSFVLDPDQVSDNAFWQGEIVNVKASYDVVIANMQTHILEPIADALCQRVNEGGLLILSGILLEHQQRIERAFGSSCDETERITRGAWACHIFRRYSC